MTRSNQRNRINENLARALQLPRDMNTTLKGTRPANHKGAWTCGFCRATNVTRLCGCAASRAEAGERTYPVVNIDDIELDLTFRGETVYF